MNIQKCQVGASNRQTKMLAGVYTTGVNVKYDDDELLQKALANLEKMSFIGIMERYEDSMLMLKRTFPDHLHTLKE